MASEDLTVLIRGQATSLISSFRKVSSEAGLSAKNTEKSFAAVGKAVALAGAAIGGVAVAIGVASVKAATTFESSQARMTTAIKNTGGSFKQFAPQIDLVDKQMEKFGFTNAETEDSIGRLTSATHSTEKALALQGLAANIARGRHIDLASATVILSKVAIGNVGALRRLGIQTKDSAGKTISATEAVRRLSDMYGGQASAASETFGGKIAALKAQMTDIAVKIGERLIPIVEGLASFVVDKAVPALESFGHWIGQNQSAVVGFSTVLGTAGIAALTAYGVELAVVAAEALATIAPIVLIGAAAAGVGVIFQKLGISWADVWDSMKTIAVDGANAVLSVLRQLSHGVNAVITVLDLIPKVNIPKIDISALGNVGGSGGTFIGPVPTPAGVTALRRLNAGEPGNLSGFIGPVPTPEGLIALRNLNSGAPTIPDLGSFDFNTPGAAGKAKKGPHEKTEKTVKIVNDFTIALGLLTPNVKFFEKQLDQTIHGVGAASAAAVAAADQFRAAKNSLLASQLDTADARRNLLHAKNDAPLARFAIQDARNRLIQDSQFGADAETLTKDQIALRDAQIDASKSTDDVKRAQVGLTSARDAEITNLHKVTNAHKLLNEVLHGFPKNSVQVLTAMGNLAKALGGTLGVKASAQHGPGNSIVINVAGHILTEHQLEQLIVKALQNHTATNGSVKKVRVSG